MMTEVSAKAHGRERTCVGCGEIADPSAMVRLVLGPGGAIAVDAAGGSFGRGAHVHPVPKCLEKACKSGLSRAYKMQITVTAEALATEVSSAFLRRAEGLLATAKRTGAIATGADATCRALALEEREDVIALVIATDAASVTTRNEIERAVASGRACAWAKKTELGNLLGKDEIAVCAVLDARVANALLDAVRTAESVRNGAGISPAKKSSEGRGPEQKKTGDGQSSSPKTGGDACLEDR